MWKRMRNLLALGLAAALLLVGCGPSPGAGESGLTGQSNLTEQSGAGGNTGSQVDNGGGEDGQKAMGRYMESDIELPMEVVYGRDLRQGEDGVELLSGDGSLYRSQDQGQNWQMVSRAPELLREKLNMGVILYIEQNQAGDTVAGYIQFQKDAEGNTDYDSATRIHALYLADGSSIPLEVPEGEYIDAAACDGEGSFYLGSNDHVYRVNGQNGSLEVMVETGGRCDYLTICGKYLMIQGEELQIYDLKEKKMAEQDPVLNEFMKPWLGQYGNAGSRPYLLYMPRTQEEGIYILTDKGLYHHTLYGSTVEQLIDGSLCSMSDPLRSFVSMVQLGDIFWVLYSGGQLKQYVFDPTVSAVPENILRVWGLYEDNDIKRAVSAFGKTHPDLYITYEHPLGEDTGMTREDAMKVLSTELATGNGPDVLVLDDLPYDTYVEKGVLADLTATLDAAGERYMETVRESYRRDGGQYAMPMSMAMPVLMGASEKIQDISSLEQLAQLAEAARASSPEGSLFGFGRAEEALQLLAIGSMDSWMDENGGMDREAVEEFLTLAERIYDAQVSGLTVKEKEAMDTIVMSMGGELITQTEAGYQASNCLSFAQPYAMGMVDSNLSVIGGYGTVAKILEILEMKFVPMPGQSPLVGQASNILAVNEASGVKSQALELVAYALSAQFARDSYMFGGSTNWDVLDAQVAKEQEDGMGAVMGLQDINGKEWTIDIDAPSQEAMEELRKLIESCQGISQCDSRIYDAVIEEGAKALTGDVSVEEAVKAIEKKVTLYLAE